MDYIIVQAGGKGTRMESLTLNKPKALVPVNNLPMIFHLFRKFPQKKFIVIGDYKYDVLKKYLAAFAEVDYKMVCATGKTGTCAGLSEALSSIPDGDSFLLTWCDLVLPDDYELPDARENVVGISKDFPCRWKYEDNIFEEERSSEFGVAGFFIFKDKSYINDVPEEGEFVRWLKSKNIKFVTQPLYKTHEYGLKSEWDKLSVSKCRPFNSLRTDGDKIYKVPLDKQGIDLAKREVAWYKKLRGMNFPNLPKIYEYEPLCMERICGKNIYEYSDISLKKKKDILSQIIKCLKQVHEIESLPAKKDSYYEAYIGKTFDRLKKVRDLVPFAKDEYISINGKKCRNVFFCRKEIETKVMEYMPEKFKLIHGDCTFSNIMLKDEKTPVLIDPRGYFGNTDLFGDAAYDWVKLYYSVYSSYDMFNLKKFALKINETDVELSVESNKWEELEDEFFSLIGNEIKHDQMKILLAITWFSLTTYAWEDYDSICGAFYNGALYLEEAFNGDGV